MKQDPDLKRILAIESISKESSHKLKIELLACGAVCIGEESRDSTFIYPDQLSDLKAFLITAEKLIRSNQ